MLPINSRLASGLLLMLSMSICFVLIAFCLAFFDLLAGFPAALIIVGRFGFCIGESCARAAHSLWYVPSLIDRGAHKLMLQTSAVLAPRTSGLISKRLASFQASMGQVIGITGVQEPPFVGLLPANSAYEIRLYQPIFVAEVPMGGPNSNQAFRSLAKYIGVFGTPENEAVKPLDMTAPVITGGPKQLAMTAPVVTGQDFMQFVLPFELKKLEDVPKPNNKDITIRQVPRKVVAVARFSGSFSQALFSAKLEELYQKLKQDQVVTDGELVKKDDHLGGLPWSYAQYNPPFTLPMFRRNEVWIELSEHSFSKVRELLQQNANSGSA